MRPPLLMRDEQRAEVAEQHPSSGDFSPRINRISQPPGAGLRETPFLDSILGSYHPTERQVNEKHPSRQRSKDRRRQLRQRH
jgi:hypothetical protein